MQPRNAPHGRIRGILRASFVLLACCTILTLAPSLALADNIYVDVNSGSDVTGTGTRGNPYKSIRHALSVAGYGDCVRVASGHYSAATSGEVFPLAVPRGVRVQGLHDPMAGAFPGARVLGDGVHRVFSITNGDANTGLDGLAISDGYAGFGAGLYINGGSSPGWGPVIQRCYFWVNTALNGGGAIHSTKGGAAACEPTIRNTYFVANEADYGGGIYAYDSDAEISRCAFVFNTSHDLTYGGGGLMSLGGTLDLDRSYFRYNVAGNDGLGGAVHLDQCDSVNVDRTYFQQNEARLGGAVYSGDSVTFQTFYDSVFRGNRADFGGAAYSRSSLLVSGCTIYSNNATTTGGAFRQAGGTLGVSNSIIWGNSTPAIASLSGSPLLSYSDIQGGGTGTGIINSPPNFYTTDPDYVPGLRLTPTSPCVDTGNPSSTGRDFLGVSRPKDGDGNGNARTDMGAFEYWLDVDRLSGPNRYETAAEMADDEPSFGHAAVIVTALDYPDALSAAGLAGLYSAPILLTSPDGLSGPTADKLRDLDVYEVFIVGGPNAVGPGVVSDLEDMGIEVTRIAGPNRYATAVAVAQYLEVRNPIWCFVARADSFPDALALGPLAYRNISPVLLVQPDSLPGDTRDALADNGYDDALIAGGDGAVSPGVKTAIEAYFPPTHVYRRAGTNRYATAAAVAEFAIDRDWLDPDYFGIATGENFPDALAGGPVCGENGGALLLTPPGALHSSASSLMSSYQDDLLEIDVFGGTGVVSDTVMNQCRTLMP